MECNKQSLCSKEEAVDTPKFVADVHLAKLAKYLRLLGLDTLYFHQIDDNDLIKIAKEQKRWILSKDRALCERERRCYLVHAKKPKEQIREILQAFHIAKCHPFTRCLKDNTPLLKIEKEKILDRLPPKVRAFYDEFWICPTCGRIYWHGTHYEKMRSFIDEVCGETL